MAGDVARGPRLAMDNIVGRDRGERPPRDVGPPPSPHPAADLGGSLLSRMGARDDTRLPQGPASYRGELGPREHYRPDVSHHVEPLHRGEQPHRDLPGRWDPPHRDPPQGPRGDASSRGGEYQMFMPNARYEARNGGASEHGPPVDTDRLRKRTVAGTFLICPVYFLNLTHVDH
jgi:hypothetical protein